MRTAAWLAVLATCFGLSTGWDFVDDVLDSDKYNELAYAVIIICWGWNYMMIVVVAGIAGFSCYLIWNWENQTLAPIAKMSISITLGVVVAIKTVLEFFF